MEFKTFNQSDAPTASQPILAGAAKSFGFVPNLLAMMAGAPALLKGYTTLAGIFDESSLSATERQIVLLATSRLNGCEYCMAAHSVIAGMQRVPADVIESLRAGKSIPDSRLEALHRFATAVVESRGWPTEAQISEFAAAGYGAQQVLEVVLGVGLKTLSNYANHIASTPLDAAFQSAKWSRAA